MNFVEWDGNTFRPSKNIPRFSIPTVGGQTWWHATTDLGRANPQTMDGVTHLGSHEAAQDRADVQELHADVHSATLCQVSLPQDLSILPDVYIENHGQKAMMAFEGKLLASNCDAAFTWNTKESSGSWTLIVRRERLGELPVKLAHDVQLISSHDWEPGGWYQQMKPLTRR